MAHVCIECLSSRCTEEYASEYHETGFIAGTEKHFNRIYRIKCPDYRKISQRKPDTCCPKIEEPYHHNRAEHFTDRARTASLDHEQHTYNRKCNNYNHELAFSEQSVHERNASEAFDSCRNCNSRR